VRVIAGASLFPTVFFATPVVRASVDTGRPQAPSALTVDDDAAPLAVIGPPAFGWHVEDTRRGAVQAGYELFVANAATRDPNDAHVIWRSGFVRSAQQSYVRPSGLDLEPDRTYWWTVRTFDGASRPGPFAPPARFDTGLNDADWGASWIRRPDIPADAVEDFMLARTVVQLGGSPIIRARAYVSAGQQYQLRINGTPVAQGPPFSYPDEQYYDATDIQRALRGGERNSVGVVAHWSRPGQGRPASVPGLIARISVDHADGTREVITTDGSWRVHTGPWRSGPPRNDEGDFVERIDARLEPIGWDTAAFDDRGWSEPAVLGTHPVAPFLHLVPARTRIVEHAVRPVSVRRHSAAYVADFGKVIAATPVVRLHTGTAGRRVRVTGGYLLDHDGRVSTTQGTQDTDMHWEYIERDGAQAFRPFGYLAFRYLEVDGVSEDLGAGAITAEGRHVSMPDEHAATFRSSDGRINAVWELARHSALYGSQEQFLDTPTREKGQFLADAENISTATMRAFGERALTAQGLRDFARSQSRYWPDGRVNAVYPNGDGARDIPDFTERFVEWAWRAYLDSGDLALLESLYPTIVGIAGYLARAIDPVTGLITDLPGGDGDYLHGIVDWPPAMRYGYDVGTAARTTLNVLGVEVFSDAAAIAGAIGRPTAEVEWLLAQAQALGDAIHAHLARPDGVLVDGLKADGGPSPHASQHANAYALAYGLVPKEQLETVARYVVDQGTAMGPMTADVLLRALHAAGRDDALIDALTDPTRPGWAQILARGATFTWESWNARDVPGDSESHAWGATVLAVLQSDILGVRIVEPGAARVNIAVPNVTNMRADGLVPTQRGPVRVSWRRDPRKFSLDLTVPANVVAVVHVPAPLARVREQQRPIVAGSRGVQRVETSKLEVVLELGSGHYELRA
jgi:alpha-L-rhamnosidase